jgi:hypothetical protein
VAAVEIDLDEVAHCVYDLLFVRVWMRRRNTMAEDYRGFIYLWEILILSPCRFVPLFPGTFSLLQEGAGYRTMAFVYSILLDLLSPGASLHYGT